MEQPGYVGVVGPGDGATAEQVRLAEEVGRLLARAGLVVVTGGLGGVMAGAARGSAREGGTSLGLLPGPDRAEANPHSSLTVPTGLGELRNGLLVRASDALIAVGPSWGTLSEVALAVRTGVPVVLLGWDRTLVEGLPAPSHGAAPVLANAPAEAVQLLLGRTDRGNRPPASRTAVGPGETLPT